MATHLAALGLLVAAYLVLAGHGQDIAPGQRLLASKEFRLITRITTNRRGDQPARHWSIEELYSNEQKRSRIAISSGPADQHRVYYHQSAHRHVFVEHNSDPKAEIKCRPVDANDYLDALLGLRLPADRSGKDHQARGSDWMSGLGPNVPDHIVGLARLALWVDSNRKVLEFKRDIVVRNVPTKAYKLPKGLEGCPLASNQLEVHYADAADQQQGLSGLPLSVFVNLKDDDWIYIDFLNAGPLREDMEEMNSRLPFDMFAYPVGLNCSKDLKPVEWSSVGSADLSFHMELLDYGNKQRLAPQRISKQFIAYDSQFELIRVDSMTSTGHSIGILDPRSQSRYHIYTDTVKSDSEAEQRGSGRSQCVRSSFSLHGDYTFKPFIRFKQLTPIGRAKIRGVDCAAFELSTDRLPTTLFHPIDCIGKEGYNRVTYSVEKELSQGEQYNLVYYFVKDPVDATKTMAAFNNQTLGALMRVDVYLRGELRYHLDITEFTYGRLVDAPNGDKVAELFALRDRCNTGEYGSLDTAKVNVELTLRLSDQVKVSSKEVASVLSSGSLRNRAVLKTLASSSPLLMTNLYDIETQFRPSDHDDELKIALEAQLSHSDVHISWPRVIGFAKLTDEAKESSFAASSAECLVYAASQQPKGYTVFVNCLNRCAVFTHPGIEYTDDGQTIVGYAKLIFESIKPTKASAAYCPLLAISKARPQSASHDEGQLLWLSDWVHRELKDSKLNLELPDPARTRISATVTHVEINNDHWSTSVGRLGGVAELSAVEKDSVEGVGLTLASGHRYSSLNDTDGQELPMDQAQCHSICASEPQCRSFSICLTSKGVECIISEVDFRDAKLLEEIEAERAKLTSRTEKKRVSVGNQVELRLDPRCKLHKRNALDMFHKALSAQLDVRDYPVVPVDNIERCAEVCWQNNQQFLAKMGKVAERLIGGAGKNSEAISKRLREEYEQHRVDWCARFFYLNLAYSSDLDWFKTVTNRTDLDKAGLCLTTGKLIYENPMSYTPYLRKFERYEYTYLSLYAAQYGKRIRLNPLEMQEGRQLKTYNYDLEYCAKACFLQMEQQLKPHCQSFDYVQSKHGYENHRDHYCVLHANTLEEIEQRGRADLIEDLAEGAQTEPDNELTVKVWHYEPKLHAMGGAMVAKRTLTSRVESARPGFGSFRVHGFGIFLVLLASIACTALIVKLRGEAIVDWLSLSDRRGSRSSIGASLNPLDS